jgi:hypothetical protein
MNIKVFFLISFVGLSCTEEKSEPELNTLVAEGHLIEMASGEIIDQVNGAALTVKDDKTGKIVSVNINYIVGVDDDNADMTIDLVDIITDETEFAKDDYYVDYASATKHKPYTVTINIREDADTNDTKGYKTIIGHADATSKWRVDTFSTLTDLYLFTNRDTLRELTNLVRGKLVQQKTAPTMVLVSTK